MTDEDPVPFRVLRMVGHPSHVELILSEDLADPDSEIVMVWRVCSDPPAGIEILNAHWRGKDYRVLDFNHSGLDFTNPDNTTTVLTMVPYPDKYQPTTLVG